MVFGKQSLQGYESNRRQADGVRVENISWNHDVGPHREDSKINDRSTVWTWALQRQDHLHVNVHRHCMGRKKEIQKDVNTIHRQWRIMLVNSRAVIGFSWGLDQKKNGTELALTNPTDHGINRAEDMMASYSRSGHPIFRASSAFERGELRSKGGRKKSIHFNGSGENIELILRTVIAANQLSVYGAIADLCNEFSKDLRAPGKASAPDHLETMEIPTGSSPKETRTNAQQRKNLVRKNTSENSNNCRETRNYSNYVLMQVWRWS